MTTARQERYGVALILAASFLLFCLYNALTPPFEASDELWHFPLVQFLATGHGLPVQHAGQTDSDAPWRQEASQPPLYYLMAAVVTAPIDSSNWRELRRINPHADNGVPTRDGNANAAPYAVEAMSHDVGFIPAGFSASTRFRCSMYVRC